MFCREVASSFRNGGNHSDTACQSSECLWNLKDLQDLKDPLMTHDCDGWCVGNRLWLPLLARASGTNAQNKLPRSLELTVRSPGFPVAPIPMRLSPMPASGVDSAAQLRIRLRRSQSLLSSWFLEVFESWWFVFGMRRHRSKGRAPLSELPRNGERDRYPFRNRQQPLRT